MEKNGYIRLWTVGLDKIEAYLDGSNPLPPLCKDSMRERCEETKNKPTCFNKCKPFCLMFWEEPEKKKKRGNKNGKDS